MLFERSINVMLNAHPFFVADYTRTRHYCILSVQSKYDNDETVRSSTSHHVTVAVANHLEVRPRGYRGIGARGRSVAVVRVRTVWSLRSGLHWTVRGFRRMRSRDGWLRTRNRLRVHRAHEHARVHTGHVDAHRLPRDLSGKRLLPGGQL